MGGGGGRRGPGRPRRGAGTRTWASATPETRPSHLRPPGAEVAREPHLSGGGAGRGGAGAGAVVVARGQRARLPMAGDWREGRGLWARGLPGDGQSRWHKFAGLAGTCAGRARAGCCAAGLAAGGWRLAPGSWLLAPGPGWERRAAPPALGAGRAERGPDVSAGGFVRPQRGPEPGSGRARVAGSAGGFLRDPPSGRAREREKLGWGWDSERGGVTDLGARTRVPETNCLTAARGFAILVFTHCADEETEARAPTPGRSVIGICRVRSPGSCMSCR